MAISRYLAYSPRIDGLKKTFSTLNLVGIWVLSITARNKLKFGRFILGP
jgi:hypothetical protein